MEQFKYLGQTILFSSCNSLSWEANRFSACQCSLPHSQQPATWPYPEPDRSSPCPHNTSWRTIIMLSSHLRLGLPSGLFLSGFSIKTLYTTLLSPIHATFTTHLILLDLITIFGEQYRSISPSLCSFLHSPVILPLSDPNIPLITLFSNTLSLRTSLKVSDQVSHPYKTRGKIIVLCILNFKFLDSKLEDRMIASIPWLQSVLNFFPNITITKTSF